jgi:hypothetical protein
VSTEYCQQYNVIGSKNPEDCCLTLHQAHDVGEPTPTNGAAVPAVAFWIRMFWHSRKANSLTPAELLGEAIGPGRRR